MIKITAPITAEWVAANERAYANRQAGRIVTMVRPGVYTAPSSKGDGTTYTTTVSNVGTLSGTCTCPHGKAGTRGHCWHLAAALAAETRRVSRPAPVSVKPARRVYADAAAEQIARQSIGRMASGMGLL